MILEIPVNDSKWLQLSISGNSSEKLHCGKVVNMPYLSVIFADRTIAPTANSGIYMVSDF